MQQQTPHQRNRARRRSAPQEVVLPGGLTTAISVGMVLVLIAVTFVADWIRAPGITLLSSSPLLSPNGDQDQDFATITYQLSDDAGVTAQIVSPRGGIVQTLFLNQSQAAGQHSLTWDGLNDLGQIVPDGVYRLELTAQGTVRATTQNANIAVDTTPPQLQLLNIPDGLRVREDTMTIEGISDPDATILVTGNPQPALVDGVGAFSFLFRLNEGSNELEVRAADPAGNTITTRRAIDLVTTPPEILIATPIDDTWTNQALTAVSGRASPGVELSVNNQTVHVTNDGTFHHQLILNEGDNLIRVSATDDVGNVMMQELLVHVKTTPPALSLNIEEGETLNESVLQLTGRTEPGAIVTVNGQVVPVGSTGSFQIGLQLFTGENIVDLQVRDRAGNTTNLTRKVIYETAAQASPLDRLLRNLSALPSLAVPALVTAGSLFAFLIFRQRGISLSLSVDQLMFQPGLPGEGKLLLIWMDLNRTTRVSIEVLDARGYPVATILRDRRRTGRRHTFAWDGYDDFGRAATPGIYTIQAEAGINPVKVTSGIQVQIAEDILVHRQPASTATVQSFGLPTPAEPAASQVIDVTVENISQAGNSSVSRASTTSSENTRVQS